MSKDTTLLMSFIGKTGFFYILRQEAVATNPKYALYSDADSYNRRSEVPIYVEAQDALADFDHELAIYPESLTTTPPAYPADKDESDYGLTPARNHWHNRFFAAIEEGRINAA